jgi:hypothetical protein
MPKLVGNNEAAKLLNMTAPAFAKGARQGRFTPAGKNAKGQPVYNPDTLRKEHEATKAIAAAQDGAALMPNELRGGKPSNDNPVAGIYLKAKASKEAAAAKILDMKWKLQEGKLIEKSLVEKQGAELGMIMIGIINSWSARLAPELASMKGSDEHDFQQKLIKETNILIEEIQQKCLDI